MNIPSITRSYDRAKKFLSDFELLETENTSRPFSLNFNKFSSEFFDCFQSDNYSNIYATCLENSDYDLLLKDGSFFQFSALPNSPKSINIERGNARFAYYHNPRFHYCYEDFLTNVVLADEPELHMEEIGDLFAVEYEQYISEAQLKKNVTPIRYDYDIKTYLPNKHALSHFHIGFNNDIRIATDKFIYPSTFVGFVIQHMYYTTWKEIHDLKYFFKSFEPISLIDNDLFNEHDRNLIHIT
ncbi:DUF2290 domain-containing protein [Lysinibacillus sp. RS11]|uniref:DUF2290 domain-containing protein n=1 Tax=Lysinibacillus sp. RS11 TaxID=3242682 RepID=UPI0035C67484